MHHLHDTITYHHIAIGNLMFKNILTSKAMSIISNQPFGIQDDRKEFLDERPPNPVYTPITASSFLPDEDESFLRRKSWLFAKVKSISASTSLLPKSLWFHCEQKHLAEKKILIRELTSMHKFI